MNLWAHGRAWLLAITLLAAPALAGNALASPVANRDVLAQLQQRVSQAAVLRGEFAQDKQVQGFKNPLRSSGRFLIAREHGVLWTTLKPFPSELVLTRDRILNRAADGKAHVAVDARQQPALRQVNAVMFALLSGDMKAMTAYFDLQPSVLAGDRWRLVLRPKGTAMARMFDSITLEGDRYVRQVVIEEHGGDRTRLQFTAMTDLPATLSIDEARRFD